MTQLYCMVGWTECAKTADGHYFFFEKRIAIRPPGIAAIDQGSFEFTAHPGMLEPLDTTSQTHS